MVNLLDLPDETLLEIIAWVPLPHNPFDSKCRYPEALCLVNKRMYSILRDLELPRKIRRYQMPELDLLRPLGSLEDPFKGKLDYDGNYYSDGYNSQDTDDDYDGDDDDGDSCDDHYMFYDHRLSDNGHDYNNERSHDDNDDGDKEAENGSEPDILAKEWAHTSRLWDELQRISFWIDMLQVHGVPRDVCKVGVAMMRFIETAQADSIEKKNRGYFANLKEVMDFMLIRSLPAPALLLWQYIVTKISEVLLRSFYHKRLGEDWDDYYSPTHLSKEAIEYLVLGRFNTGTVRRAFMDHYFCNRHKEILAGDEKYIRLASEDVAWGVKRDLRAAECWGRDLPGDPTKEAKDPMVASSRALAVSTSALQARLARLTKSTRD